MAAYCIGDPDKRTYAAMGLEQYNLLKLFTDPALKKRRAENKAAGYAQNWAATKLQDGAQLPGPRSSTRAEASAGFTAALIPAISRRSARCSSVPARPYRSRSSMYVGFA